MRDDLVDGIYEAAFVPEMWQPLLQSLADSTASREAGFVFVDGGRGGWVATERCASFVSKYENDVDLYIRSLRAERMDATAHAGFLSVHGLLSDEELNDDVYQRYLRSDGLEWQALTRIELPGGQMLTFSIERAAEAGPFGESEIAVLDGMRPHLARAGMIAARLGLSKAQATVSALAALGLPAAVLSPKGRVISTNEPFDQLQQLFLPVAFGGIAISDVPANRLLREAIAANASSPQPLVRSIPVRPEEDRPAAVVHVLPLRRAAHDLFSGADILLVATEVRAEANVPASQLLRALFDLSPAEAKLAAGFAAGKTLKQIAADMNVAISTARTYLARVFAKTGTSQQSQLVALLRSAHPLIM